jgi:hypothetical protein
MKLIEVALENRRNTVIASPSSIFSKADVILILEQMQTTVLDLLEEAREEAKLTSGLITFKENLLQEFRKELDDNRYGEYIDQDSAEFNISYDNRIELSNIDINIDELENALERAFDIVENSN